MPAWLRYSVLAAFGLMALVGIFCTQWLDEVEAQCPGTWSRCERSYAYVTGVEPDHATAADEGIRVDRCDVVARLPLARLDEKPTGNGERLLDGATRIDTREDDYDRVCDRWLHTWQAVVYDPQHRSSRVKFTSLPKSSGFDLRKLLLVIVAALCLGYPIWTRYGGRIAGWWERAGETSQRHGNTRKQRKQERAKRKRAAFYAEIRAESAKIDAAVTAEAKDAGRSPPKRD
jgi:hypothetical protein